RGEAGRAHPATLLAGGGLRERGHRSISFRRVGDRAEGVFAEAEERVGLVAADEPVEPEVPSTRRRAAGVRPRQGHRALRTRRLLGWRRRRKRQGNRLVPGIAGLSRRGGGREEDGAGTGGEHAEHWNPPPTGHTTHPRAAASRSRGPLDAKR